MLGIWFRRAGACAKFWEECIAKVRQKLVFWEHYSLSISGKNLVIRSEELSLLLYVAQAWPIPQKMGLALLPRNAPSSWTIPYHLSFMEKFAKKNIFDHKSIRKWSTCRVLETLQEKEGGSCRVLQIKELTSTKCCRLAHSKVQDYVLRVRLKLGAPATKVQWGRPLSEVFLLKGVCLLSGHLSTSYAPVKRVPAFPYNSVFYTRQHP
eukprot:g33662.t1